MRLRFRVVPSSYDWRRCRFLETHIRKYCEQLQQVCSAFDLSGFHEHPVCEAIRQKLLEDWNNPGFSGLLSELPVLFILLFTSCSQQFSQGWILLGGVGGLHFGVLFASAAALAEA